MKCLIQIIAVVLFVSCSHLGDIQRKTASIQPVKFSCLDPEQVVNIGLVLEMPHFPTNTDAHLLLEDNNDIREYDMNIATRTEYKNDQNYKVTANFSKDSVLEIEVFEQDHFVKIEDGKFNYEGRELQCTVEKL